MNKTKMDKKAKGKNQNVLQQLEKAVNKTANPHFNKKSKVENFDKDLITMKESKGKLKSRIEGPDSIMEFNDLANLTNKKYEVISEAEANQGIKRIIYSNGKRVFSRLEKSLSRRRNEKYQ